MSDIDLRNLSLTSGVNEQGTPFCTVTATGTKGTILMGQLSPDEMRAQGRAFFEVAEAAEQDAAVLRVCRKIEVADEFAAAVIVELRAMREGGAS